MPNSTVHHRISCGRNVGLIARTKVVSSWQNPPFGRSPPTTNENGIGGNNSAIKDASARGGQVGDAEVFAEARPFQPVKAIIALAVFVGAIAIATLKITPIAAVAFAGAVLLILLRVITADEAYGGLIVLKNPALRQALARA